MGDGTGIEWTDATWNPIRGCSKVSEGCKHCYAETVAARFSGPGQPYHGTIRDGRWSGELVIAGSHLDDPLRWKRPRRIFVNSMSDLFHEKVPDDIIAKVFSVMEKATRHTFQILTKRPERMRDWIGGASGAGLSASPLPNVWLGVSVENQSAADKRIPLLLDVPAAVRFLSCEPLLGPLDLSRWLRLDYGDVCGWGFSPLEAARLIDGGEPAPALHWVIVGGESGHGARPMHPEWARELRDQCQAARVPLFFKQWGEWWPIGQMPHGFSDTLYFPRPATNPEASRRCRVEQMVLHVDGKHQAIDSADWCDGAMLAYRVGKRTAGGLLDGRTQQEFPDV